MTSAPEAAQAILELRMFNEADHPRGGKGTTTGGQFVTSQGPKTPTKSAPERPAKSTPAAKRTPPKAAPSQHLDDGSMSYDPKTNRGTGYGVKGGDTRVRGLQEALNRLGLTDDRGKALSVDGKLGPLTTAAVKAAQRRLGVTADGKVTPALLSKLTAAKSLLGRHKVCRSEEHMGEERDDPRTMPEVCVRAFDFETKDISSDGRTLEGYVAVFGSVARIPDAKGDFDEEIHRGAFDRSLTRGLPVMQFEHGRDPRVGALPIGVYEVFEPDHKGYFVRGRLLDDPVVEPIRKAIEAGAIKGMSWRMQVPEQGQKWTRRSGYDKRDVIDADVPEAGPVVFPAYSATTVGVRSLLSAMDDDEIRHLVRELAAHLGLATDLSDLSGRPDARSAGGADFDAATQERGASPQPHLRQRLDAGALRVRGILP